MLCDICHKNIATVHLTEIIDDKVVEMHICQSCSKFKSEELKEQLSSGALMGIFSEKSGSTREDKLLKCSFCGMTYEEFKKKGKMGCGNCYVTFKSKVTGVLKKIHGSNHHVGKCPLPLGTDVSVNAKAEKLRDRLERAILLEEYEEAARLRDELRTLKKDV